jgi:hypothetical protein
MRWRWRWLAFAAAAWVIVIAGLFALWVCWEIAAAVLGNLLL